MASSRPLLLTAAPLQQPKTGKTCGCRACLWCVKLGEVGCSKQNCRASTLLVFADGDIDMVLEEDDGGVQKGHAEAEKLAVFLEFRSAPSPLAGGTRTAGRCYNTPEPRC